MADREILKEQLEREHGELLEELRSLIPGAEVLFGFLLAIRFTGQFGDSRTTPSAMSTTRRSSQRPSRSSCSSPRRRITGFASARATRTTCCARATGGDRRHSLHRPRLHRSRLPHHRARLRNDGGGRHCDRLLRVHRLALVELRAIPVATAEPLTPDLSWAPVAEPQAKRAMLIGLDSAEPSLVEAGATSCLRSRG